MKQGFEFVKQIRRLEIKRAIEDLRSYQKEAEETKKIAGQLGYPTLESYDYALVAELVAATSKVSKLFKVRNSFDFGGVCNA
jgi:hypothetical protein